MRNVGLAAIQMASTGAYDSNIANAERLVREAAACGGNVILLQELFDGNYFCQDEDPAVFRLAKPVEGHPTIEHFQALARELGVVLPISFFEKAHNVFFNSIAVIDADGAVLGTYRKSHIPHGSGYQEKYYFSPGNTGFKVWDTAFGKIGVGICWDQWFPECARSMALMGAEVLLYPTAIGSELLDPSMDSSAHWRRVMQGHAGANLIPLVTSNRIGTEPGKAGTELTFYGSSFITDETGALVAEADNSTEAVLVHHFDFDAIAESRSFWGLFRDRRPDLYSTLATLDGVVRE